MRSLPLMHLGSWTVLIVCPLLVATVDIPEGFEDLISSEDDDEDDEEDEISDDDIDRVEDKNVPALESQQMLGLHSKLDLDGDGKASFTEIMTYAYDMRALRAKKDVEAILHDMDTDKDGKLSLNEMINDEWGGDEENFPRKYGLRSEFSFRLGGAGNKELEIQKFKLADLNGDQLLSVEEFPAMFYPETHQGVLELMVAETMKIKDLDRNGQLDAKEFYGEDEDEDLEISEEEEADFQSLDSDGNGQLSLEELKAWDSGKFYIEAAMRELFEISDKNSDTHITADEFDSSRAAIANIDAQDHLEEWAAHHEL